MKVLVVGAGAFGCSIALELFNCNFDVTLIETNSSIMMGASKNNHNRIHYGYHYPRSLETALQSLDGLNSFLENYSECIVKNFPNYYAIAKHGSHVSSYDYIQFCNNANIEYKSEFPNSLYLNNNLIDTSFKVNEPIFDWEIFKELIDKKISKTNIKLKLNTSFFSVNHTDYDYIINCSYANINVINKFLGAECIEFKLQDVIVPIFTYNSPKIGITVMDGPFCSIMPKGNTSNTFLLYHAKYSILKETYENELSCAKDVKDNLQHLINDSINYFPFLNNVSFVDYWQTIRALPITTNDERLSKVMISKSYPKLITIFSGKITTCVDVAREVKEKLIST